jgi:predicted RNA-binding protein (virulence factor B family)
MPIVGKLNTLIITRQVPFGVYLDGGVLGEILLPRLEVPAGAVVGSAVEVFVYHDSDDRLIATTRTPRARVGQCVSLRCVQVNHAGAFLDWGLPKDLLVPFGEQRVPMREDNSYVVYVYLDTPSGRIAASSKLDHWLSEDGCGFAAMQPVNLLVCGRTDLGFKAVVDGTHLGLIFKTEVLQPLRMGQKLKGFVRRVREDGRLDLCLQKQGQEVRDELAELILAHLAANGGVSPLCDHSTPEAIHAVYKVSKGNYKKAIGGLLRKGLIVVHPDHIALAPASPWKRAGRPQR